MLLTIPQNFCGSCLPAICMYFPIPGARARLRLSLPDQVPEQVKKERALRLRQLSDEKRRRFYAGHAGAILPVLVENRRQQKNRPAAGHIAQLYSCAF